MAAISLSLVVPSGHGVLDLPDELHPDLRHVVPCTDGIKNPGVSSIEITLQTVLGKPGPDLYVNHLQGASVRSILVRPETHLYID